MTFIFRNRTIFWNISKWNKGQKKWDRESNFFFFFKEFQLITSAPDDSSLSSNQDTNQFLVSAEIEL